MRKPLYISVLLLLICTIAAAQSYNPVKHITGKRTIAGIEVTVSPKDAPILYPDTNWCSAGPYWIGHKAPGAGSTGTSYVFNFSKAIRAVRLQLTASDTGEEISIKINGSAYPLVAAQLSNFTGSCGLNGNSLLSSGNITFRNGSGIIGNNTQVIITDSISEIEVRNENFAGGTFFNFHFIVDTVVNIEEYKDTLLCVRDSMHIKYVMAGTFAPGNTFTFQLSDKYGSFVSPTILGSVSSVTSGVFTCLTPVVASGKDYRIRVVSSSPAYTSAPYKIPLAIGNPPIGAAYNTGPVCEGELIKFGMNMFSHFSDVFWQGPGVLLNTPLQHVSLNASALKDAGRYIGKMVDYGCVAYDSTELVINPNPVRAIGSNNSPICTGDTLKLSSNIDTAGALNIWLSPGGSTDTANTLVIPGGKLADSGLYILTTKLNGCTARDTTYVVVKPTPVPGISINDACVGDSLWLRSTDATKGAVYNWTGPGGFVSTVKDTVIRTALFAASGVYHIIINANGCIARDSVKATIKLKPAVPKAANNAPVCEGKALELYGSDIMQGAAYKWEGPGGYKVTGINATIGNIAMAAAGNYIITADLDGCTASDTTVVTVKHTPLVPDVSSNSPLKTGKTLYLKLADPEIGIGFTWTGPNGFHTNILNPSIEKVKKLHEGTYSLTAAKDGCITAALVLVTIDDLVDTGFVILYPNPNNGNFTIKGTFLKDQQVGLHIVNAVGQSIYKEGAKTENGVFYHEVKLKDRLSGGVYVLRLTMDGSIRDIPFVVARSAY